ncbi:TPA: beta-ketoacyl-ACP synthase III [Haemophilus influenzae]|uniref:beta-ketoacyl-ACP synthase III n=1 Tax=Haemophilus influenzae TaxID=727 RepID=UPI000CFFF236|nr:beta-ketoacyl-ACP synthase III [Haemophilus influenzae]PRI47193.1 3-oxoacyl-[acyl-carrier-protein] synthase 3 [Haemophilus influenzae]PRJ55372.1 3-oxoacyl-[acyl-carrier-protein] synthase 3 [Haemophilus influenzae]PRJ58700.1 3-oxoacyl-[acyl-carrier-protein] synthase 3 [Haemophilus influenzae]PRJ90767.1 3-oxoacyl-[acyl-carrier-protein] synthase 3 [Haemophilus influenzae]PRK62552.1 3-oxoacyl-[acyl-carrier-protein] synthase 3 [Haemophilus influenzae]
MQNVYINKISSFLPNKPVSNEQMEAVLGMVGDVPSRVRKMILRSNGIEQRYYAIDSTTRQTTHTSTELAVQAIKNLGISANDFSVLAVGTSYPDQILPGQGVMVHGLLDNAPPMEVMSMAGVCVAGMAAMKHAYNAVKTGEHQSAVAVSSECASAIMRSENFKLEVAQKQLEEAKPEIGFEKDFLRWMLSDGAGAVQLSNQPNEQGFSFKIHWIDLVSYANEMPVCMYAGGEVQNEQFISWKSVSATERDAKSFMAIKQDVKLLNENIVKYTVEKALSRIVKKYQLKADEIDYLLPHYSSNFFRNRLLEGLRNINFEIPQKKWFTNLTQCGNTGSASIYIILEEFVRTFDLRSGQKVLCYVPESGRFSSCFMLLEVV